MASREESKEKEIYRALTMKTLFGYPFNTAIVGFKMLAEAIMLTLEDDGLYTDMQDIYEKIAKERKIKANSVDKSIKKAIESVTSVIKMDKENYHNVVIQQAFMDGRPKSLILATSEMIKAEKLAYMQNLQQD